MKKCQLLPEIKTSTLLRCAGIPSQRNEIQFQNPLHSGTNSINTSFTITLKNVFEIRSAREIFSATFSQFQSGNEILTSPRIKSYRTQIIQREDLFLARRRIFTYYTNVYYRLIGSGIRWKYMNSHRHHTREIFRFSRDSHAENAILSSTKAEEKGRRKIK